MILILILILCTKLIQQGQALSRSREDVNFMHVPSLDSVFVSDLISAGSMRL